MPLSLTQAALLMLLLIVTVLPVAVMLHPLLDDLIIEIGQSRAFHLFYLFELLPYHLKLQLRKILMEILRDALSRFIDNRVPIRAIVVLRI